MALVDSTWYVNFGDGSTTGHFAVAKRPQNTAVVAGQLCRQFTAPTAGNERVFVCIVAGTTANTTDATWTLTRGAKTTDGTATWMECSGQAAVNGDLTNTATWAQVKLATPAVLGQIIKRSNNASYQICTTAGAMSASEPAFSDTAGVTTTDTTAVWTSLGAVSNFTGGQAPHARLSTVFGTNWFASGNTVYVGDNHAETFAGTMNITGSSALMARIMCHNRSGSYPPTSGNITTGATISATGSVGLITIGMQGSFYFYGLTFIALASGGTGGSNGMIIGSNTVGQVQNWYYFDTCSLRNGDPGQGAFFIGVGTSASGWNVVTFDNTTIKTADVRQYIETQFVDFTWRNTGPILATGSAVPTTLFHSASTNGRVSTVVLEGIDLSQITGSLFANSLAASIGSYTIQDCKLNASVTVTTPINTGMQVQLNRCDSSATTYKSTRYAYEGTETTETSIVRSGGAVDPSGQAQTRKIVTTANAQWLRPFEAEPYAIWNATTGGNVTVTVYGVVVGASSISGPPTNDEIWIEVEYLGSSATPLGKIITTTKANVLAAAAAGVSDTSTWSNLPTTRAAVTTMFDASVSIQATLSNGNLTATHSQTANTNTDCAGTLFPRSSGKYYCEFTIGATHGATDSVGCNLSANTFDASNSANTITYIKTGAVWVNSSNALGNIGTWTTADVIGMAVDLDNRKVWFRKNGGNWNNAAIGSQNPATNTGGASITVAGAYSPYVGFNGSGSLNTDNVTANFGATSYGAAAPAGFGNWLDDGVGVAIFKLTTTLSAPQPGLAGYLNVRVRAAKASATYYIDPKIALS